MGEARFTADDLKQLQGYWDHLASCVADLVATQRDPAKAGPGAAEIELVIKRWWWLYQGMATSLRRKGLLITRWDTVAEVKSGSVIADYRKPREKKLSSGIYRWLKERLAESHRKIGELESAMDGKTRNERRVINVIANAWISERDTAERCINSLAVTFGDVPARLSRPGNK